MKLLLIGHTHRFALEQLQLQLFPDEPMEPADAPFSGDGAVSTLYRGNTWLTARTSVTYHGRTVRADKRLRTDRADYRLLRRCLQQSYYLAAVQLLETAPAWGALSGVRPSKLTTQHLLQGGTKTSADRLLRDVYFVSPARRALCLSASEATLDALGKMRPADVSLYLGIPFCPTRCAYCSFVSVGIGHFSDLLSPYLDALLQEIAHTGRLLRASGRHIRTLYIGGGTPTTLTAAQLRILMEAIRTHFDLTDLIEYTVEGGRPDTLDAEKLSVLRTLGCDRISINPQTMNDRVLSAVGRCHTAAQTLEAFAAAKQAGFAEINMDLIAGLPGDDPESFASSCSQVLALRPTNLTVHTLAMKKGADLFFSRLSLPCADAVDTMLSGAQAALRQSGYRPYYLYRQKYMSGSFENVGWCLPGSSCYYNIYMMEELHTILSLGGGAMTKVNLPSGKLVRFHNPKYPKEYIERIGAVLSQKDEVFRLLDAPCV